MFDEVCEGERGWGGGDVCVGGGEGGGGASQWMIP